MRTTLTLDPDVAAMVERRRREEGASLKDVVNEALRRGLRAPEGRQAPTSYSTPPVSLGRPLLGDLDDVSEVLAMSEGEGFG